MIVKGIVTLTLRNGTVRTWSNSFILNSDGRITVHAGNFIRATYRSEFVNLAELTLDESEEKNTPA